MSKPPLIRTKELNILSLLLLVFVLSSKIETSFAQCRFVGKRGLVQMDAPDTALETENIWDGTIRKQIKSLELTERIRNIIRYTITHCSDDSEGICDDNNTDDDDIVMIFPIQPQFGIILDFTGQTQISDPLKVHFEDDTVENCRIEINFVDQNNQPPLFNFTETPPLMYSIKSSWDTSIALNWRTDNRIRITDFDFTKAVPIITTSNEDVIEGRVQETTNNVAYPNRYIYDLQLFLKNLPQVESEEYVITASDSVHEASFNVIINFLPENPPPKFQRAYYYIQKTEMPKMGDIVDDDLFADTGFQGDIVNLIIDETVQDFITLNWDGNRLIFSRDVQNEDLDENKIVVFQVEAVVDGEGNEERRAVTTVVITVPFVDEPCPELPTCPTIPDPECPELPTCPTIPDPECPELPTCPTIPDPECPEPPTCPTISDPECPEPPTCPTIPDPECPEPPTCPTTQGPGCPECPSTTHNPNCPEPPECSECSTTHAEDCPEISTCPTCKDDCSNDGLLAATITTSILCAASIALAGYLAWVLRKASINPFNFSGNNIATTPKSLEANNGFSSKPNGFSQSPPSPPPSFIPPPPPSTKVPSRLFENQLNFGESLDVKPTSTAEEPGITNPTFNSDESPIAPSGVLPLTTAVSPAQTPTSPTTQKPIMKAPKEIEPDYEEGHGKSSKSSSSRKTSISSEPRSRKVSRVKFAEDTDNSKLEKEHEYEKISTNDASGNAGNAKEDDAESEDVYERL